MRSPIPWETERVPAHPAVVLGTRPRVSVGLVPALLVCLAAPAFFVVRIPWIGWVLLAAGMLAAWLVRSRTDAEAEAARASVPSAARAVRRRARRAWCAICRSSHSDC